VKTFGGLIMSVIKLEKTYPVPKEALWNYLIKDELLSSWCMPTKNFNATVSPQFIKAEIYF